MPKVSSITFDNDIPTNRFDTTIEWLLIGLITFMPFTFGVVHAWSEEVVVIVSGTIVICFLLKFLLYNNQRLIWTWAYVPLLLFLILVTIQLIPLPTWLVSIISPNTANMRKELLGDLPNADEILKSMTLTFYPHATKHDLRLILALGGVFFVVLNVFHNAEKIKRLLTAIVIIGALIAVVTLAQDLVGNGKTFWFINNRYLGPFVNHSHYGQFMNLSIGAATGLLMVKLHDTFINKQITLPEVFKYLSSNASISLWILIAMIGFGMATIFLSLTRGGIVSMLISMFCITLLISSKHHLRSHNWIMVSVALIAFICILYIGFDATYDRLATLRNLNEASESRLQMLKDTIIAWSKFPLFGTGLGTYSVVYPMFDNSMITAFASHAENEYAQTTEETGLIGLGLLIIFGIIVGINFFKNIKRTDFPIYSAAYGLAFGLIAILFHSFADFGQHLPANAFLSVIFCALLISMAQYGQKRNLIFIKTSSYKNRSISIIILLFVSGIFTWAFIGANNSRLAEEHRKKVQVIENVLAKTNWQADEEIYKELLDQASSIIVYEPENVKNLYLFNVYRWRSINRNENHNISNTYVSDESMPLVHDIVEKLNIARKLCPTYGPIYVLAGQIEKYILDIDSGADQIRKGFLLAPCNSIACFVAGCLDISEGKYEQCLVKFDRAAKLNSKLFPEVINIYVEELSLPYKAISLAGNDIIRLNQLMGMFTTAQYMDLAQQCREKMKNLLEEKCSTPKATASDNAFLAGIYKQLNDVESSIEYYRRALMLDYSQVNWRIELAKLLAKTNKMPEAMREAKTCLRISPDSKEAEKLVADFSLSPTAWNTETN